jgi:hypothetical protein
LDQLWDGFENHVIHVSKLALATKRLKLGPMEIRKKKKKTWPDGQ